MTLAANPAFMLTAGGREYWLSGPNAMVKNPPRIEDIAHHLAQINRFTGACKRPYSVAEHSMLVERIGAARGASPALRLALLMHDAHEAYTSDASSPAKIAIGLGWTSFEALHATNIRHHFGLRTAFAGWRREITYCDLVALATERRDLLIWDEHENLPWEVIDAPGHRIEPFACERIQDDDAPLSWKEMRDAFVHRYLMLQQLAFSSGEVLA